MEAAPPPRDTARAMSEENVEVARRLYPGRFDLVLALRKPTAFEAVVKPLIHPGFETVSAPRQVPVSGAGAEAYDALPHRQLIPHSPVRSLVTEGISRASSVRSAL